MDLERVKKCLEVKKVRPVKTMWPSLIPTSYRNAAERTTRAARPAPGYISADKLLNYPVSNSSVVVSQAGRSQRHCLCDYYNSQFALVVLHMCCVLFFSRCSCTTPQGSNHRGFFKTFFFNRSIFFPLEKHNGVPATKSYIISWRMKIYSLFICIDSLWNWGPFRCTLGLRSDCRFSNWILRPDCPHIFRVSK